MQFVVTRSDAAYSGINLPPFQGIGLPALAGWLPGQRLMMISRRRVEGKEDISNSQNSLTQ
jgi:hypothetical protein